MIQVELPEGAIFQHAVTVASYFDEGGGMKYVVQTTGEASASSVLGIMELAKADIVRWASE